MDQLMPWHNNSELFNVKRDTLFFWFIFSKVTKELIDHIYNYTVNELYFQELFEKKLKWQK